ncbi:MAG: hypothetical protein U0T81_04190 [Saprospiraceae bacterium]
MPWLASAIATEGMWPWHSLTNNSSGAPDKCSGVTLVTFTPQQVTAKPRYVC